MPKCISHRVSTGPRSAFTLVEVLVVVIIIAILMSILVPVGRGATRLGEDTASAGALRQVATAVLTYSYDYKGSFPYFAVPGDPNSPYELIGEDIRWTRPGYFRRQSFMYASLLREMGYLSGLPNLRPRPFVVAQAHDGKLIWTRMLLTNSAFADPKFWSGPAEPSHPDRYLRGMRVTQIRWPSRKGILLDHDGGDGGYRDKQLSFAAADGSVHRIPWPYGSNRWVVRKLGDPLLGPVMTTRDGVRGVDW